MIAQKGEVDDIIGCHEIPNWVFRKESGNDLKAAMKNHEDIHRFTGVRFMGGK